MRQEMRVDERGDETHEMHGNVTTMLCHMARNGAANMGRALQ